MSCLAYRLTQRLVLAPYMIENESSVIESEICLLVFWNCLIKLSSQFHQRIHGYLPEQVKVLSKKGVKIR